jgi:hypothetical protein
MSGIDGTQVRRSLSTPRRAADAPEGQAAASNQCPPKSASGQTSLVQVPGSSADPAANAAAASALLVGAPHRRSFGRCVCASVFGCGCE